jgi:purine catabolism regulator
MTRISDSSGHLSGGEFLFVDEPVDADRAEAVGRILGRWDEAGVAGVAMVLGHRQESLPEPCVAEAEKRRLPLLVLPEGVETRVLAAEVDRAVLADQRARLLRMERVARAFADLAVCACGTRPQEILDRLAALVDRPLVMFDEFGYAVETRGLADLRDEVVRRHDHAPDTAVGPRLAESTGSGEGCLWMPLALRGVPYGSVHLAAAGRPFDEVDVVALDRAVAALATSLLLREQDQRLSLQAQRNLVADLVAGRRGTETEFAQRARDLGAELAGRRLAVMVVVAVPPTEEAADPPAWQVIVDCLASAAREHDSTVLCGGTAETAVAVFGLADEESLATVASAALARLRRRHPPGAAVATSLACFPVLAHAFDTATRLASYGAQRASGVYPVEEYRLELLLQRLNGSGDLTHFVRDEIGPLLEHDSRGGQAMLPTLRAFIASGGAKTVTAQRLRVVRRTLYRRLAEIEKILGRDLSDGDAVMRISLALWAWDTISTR